jgi:hypothetical protein
MVLRLVVWHSLTMFDPSKFHWSPTKSHRKFTTGTLLAREVSFAKHFWIARDPCMKHRTWTWSVYDTYAVLAIWHVLHFMINAFQEVFNTCSSLRTEDLKVFLWVSCFIREAFDWIGAIFVDNNLVSGCQWHGMMVRAGIVLAGVLLVAAGIRLEGWQMDASGWKFSSVEVHSKRKMGGYFIRARYMEKTSCFWLPY